MARFFNSSLANLEPIIIESPPNVRPSDQIIFNVPEHIVGTKNLFIYLDGILQTDYEDISYNTIKFNQPVSVDKYFKAVFLPHPSGGISDSIQWEEF